MRITSASRSYFSLEAIFENPVEELSSTTLLERAFLSLQKQCEIAVSSHLISSMKEFTIPKDWVSGIRLLSKLNF